MVRKTTAFALALAMLLSVLPLGSVEAQSAPTLLNKLYITADAANVRLAPSLSSPVVTKIFRNDYVLVSEPVQGEAVDGNTTWYRTRSGWYISESVTTNVPGNPNVVFRGPRGERWIDVDLSSNTATAMQGSRAVYSAPVVTGRPGQDTPIGTFRIQWRAQTRTMDSSTVGIPLDEEGAYLIPNVRWAMYFTNQGDAIHGNYWVPPSMFGSGKTSRGCVGLNNADARAFFAFADVGTKVVIHY